MQQDPKLWALRRLTGVSLPVMILIASRGCHHCCNRVLWACTGHPPLSSRPDLVAQWHPTRNGTKTPSDMSLGSEFRASWLCQACSCGRPHEWDTLVLQRALGGTGCPFCAERKPCACKSLTTLHPAVAASWDHEGNAELTPDDVSMSSHKKVWWVCHKHEKPYYWRARVDHRARRSKPTGCPSCAREARRHGKSKS